MPAELASLLPSSGRAAVMGILNITPDSFSDGGRFVGSHGVDVDAVLRQADLMVNAGVDIFDVGGESTRPGASPVPEAEELDRVVPVVSALAGRFGIPVSVDTSVPAVMKAAVEAGAVLINDVRALSRPGALATVADCGVPVCLMHMPGEPGEMQALARYDNVVASVTNYLIQRAELCVQAGISRGKIILDPGFGFGKNLEHNLALFRALPDFVALGFPLLVGVSRKRMVGDILGKNVDQRLYGSVSLALLAARSGVKILRVHDVEATVDALSILQAVEKDPSL